MKMKCILFLCVLILLSLSCESGNIVVYIPLPFYSHQITFKPLWLELARRGHKITLIQCNAIVENHENITNIVLNETYTILNQSKAHDGLAKGESIMTTVFNGLQSLSVGMEYQISHPGVKELLNNGEKVDLFFTEFISSFGFFLGRKLKAPIIGISSLDAPVSTHMSMGNPTHPVMYPNKDCSVSQEMTFKDRLKSSIYWFGLLLLGKFILDPTQEKVIQKYFGEVMSTKDVIKDISLLFINANPLFNPARPLGPATINLGGGIHLQKPHPLPKELQNYLDQADKGVIYFSLGSILGNKQMLPATQKIILDTFSELPYKVLCKFHAEPSNVPKNVKVMKWLPQQDVLRHKNVKLFITQGGLQSMEEAIFNYIPMVALPFYGDQPSNANKMVSRGFGITLHHSNLDVETFKGAILEVINNPEYKENIKRLVDLILDQPMTGLENAVWWTEYVLRHGHTNIFRNPSLDIPWYQYLFFDVICFLCVAIVIVMFIFTKLFQLFKRLVRSKKTKTS